MIKRFLLVGLVLSLASCAQQRREIDRVTERAANQIRVMNSEPQGTCEYLGAIAAEDGGGCGFFGRRGTYQGAVSELKYLAWKEGANVAVVDNVRTPGRLVNGCMELGYILEARALKCER